MDTDTRNQTMNIDMLPPETPGERPPPVSSNEEHEMPPVSTEVDRPRPRGSIFRLGRRPSLDGIRGWAVLMVMAYHMDSERLFPGGFIGVDIFFVLSGFLITTLLVEEWTARGRIDLRSFYIRRALRLFPAFLCIVFFASALISAHKLFSTPGDSETPLFRTLLTSFLYLNNWVNAFNWWNLGPLNHTWSLAVEEQFYLIWPATLLFALRSGWTRRRLMLLVTLAIGVSVVLRYLLWPDIADFNRATFGLDVNAASLLIGALLGLVATEGWLPRGRRFILALRPVAVASIIGLLYFGRTGTRSMTFLRDGGYALIALAAATLVCLALVDQSAPLRLVFNNRVMTYIGSISYGLYLWHDPIYRTLYARSLPGIVDYPLRIILSFAAAICSYYIVEKPFLRLKSKFGASRAPVAAATEPIAAIAEPAPAAQF
jgi:peptidoglycan/LPS O-acetylase OafA/YrhL